MGAVGRKLGFKLRQTLQTGLILSPFPGT